MTTPSEADAIPGETKLLPCPFCSATLNYVESNDGEPVAQHPHSDECVLSQFYVWGNEPIAAWNRRTRNAPDTGGAAEPVAWGRFSRTTGILSATTDKAVADQWAADADQSEFPTLPLYTAPPAPAASPACGGEADGEGYYALTDSDWPWDDQDEGRATVVLASNPMDAVRRATEMESEKNCGGWGICWKVARLIDIGFCGVNVEDGLEPSFEEFTPYRSALASPEQGEGVRELVEVLKLHVAYEAMPADRGGKNGPKGRAWQQEGESDV